MGNIENLCKALRCIASFNGTEDCYKEQHNKQCRTGEVKGPKVVCGINPPEGYIICPYYQDDYGVCAEDGELFWLSEVADILEGKTGEWAGTVCTSCGASVSNYYDCDYCPNCGSKNT